MIVAGVDPSLTSTGVAVVGDHPDDTPDLRTVRTSPGMGLSKLERMRYVVGEVYAMCRGADLVVVESLSFASHGSATRDLAGLWWMLVDRLTVRDRLGDPGRPWAHVPPSTLKRWATGSGIATKDEVRAELARRWRLAVRDMNRDESDALGLASMGLHSGGALPWAPSETQVDALSKMTKHGAIVPV